MNKKGLGQGKLISLFTFQREILERGKRRAERVLKRFRNPAGEKLREDKFGHRIEEDFGHKF